MVQMESIIFWKGLTKMAIIYYIDGHQSCANMKKERNF